MRTWTTLTMLLACALLACSLTTGRDDADDPSEEALRPPPPPTGPSTVITAAVPYFGEESIEERIARADTIVKARLNQTTSETITSTDEGWIGKYYVALKFHLTVSEYLNGSGEAASPRLRFRVEHTTHRRKPRLRRRALLPRELPRGTTGKRSSS